jgi:hypothetical protein
MSADHWADQVGVWEEVDNSVWQQGDIIWQSRMPGGECLLLRVYDTLEEYTKESPHQVARPGGSGPIWGEHDFPVLRVLHPSEGMIEDPSYYYDTLERASEIAERTQKSLK